MEQIKINADEKTKKVNTPTSSAKFAIPQIDATLEKIEVEEEADDEEEGMMAMAILAAILGIRKNKKGNDSEERLAKEMEKIHPREKKKSGCGCGF